MRLYLTIIRNALPPIKTVWPVPATQTQQTVSQLVSSINDVFPLETDHWGLEDYIVMLAGFECLHYHETSTIFQDGDEITIRPLQNAEIRGRTISGRDQITSGGRHLLDGVAFGRSALKAPVRPHVSIPPRKRQRLEEPVAEEYNQALVVYQEQGDTAAEDLSSEEDSSEDDDYSTSEDSASESGVSEDDTSSGSDPSDEDTSSDTSSDSSSTGDASSPDAESETSWHGVSPSKPEHTQSRTFGTGIPHEGLAATQARNKRRRLAGRLKYLKSTGALHQNATFEELSAYEGRDQANDAQELQLQKQRLLEAIASGGIEVTDHPEEEAPEVLSSKAPMRSKLNIASSNRLVFGSLGVRAPRNEQEKEAVRQKLAGPSLKDRLKDIRQSRLATIPSQAQGQELVHQPEEDWRDKINLQAVECCDPVELTTPPFPFKQRWDPQYSRKNRKRNNAAAEEHHDKYNGVSDYLEYDDVPDDHAEGQDTLSEHMPNGTSNGHADGLPPLPDDYTTLPVLNEDKARVYDCIVYKELVCSAETGYQPDWILHRAQLLADHGDGSWKLKLALRDLAPKHDDEGNRVYGKFEVPMDEADGSSDDHLRTVNWSELVEPRLLLREEASEPVA